MSAGLFFLGALSFIAAGRLIFMLLFSGFASKPMTKLLEEAFPEPSGGIDLLCSKAINSGTFDGHLTSVTWSGPDSADFCIDKTCARVKRSTLGQTGVMVNVVPVWSLSKVREKVLPKPGEPVTGVYFFDLMRGSKKERLHLYMQDTSMMIEGVWTKNVASFTLVHGPPLKDGAVPYMFAIDKDEQTKHTIFFSLTMDASKGYNFNLGQKDKHYFATWLPGVNSTLRLVPKALGAPKLDAFSKLPKGVWTDVDNGTVFLFDDQLGCVFTVAGWSSGLNLSAKYDQNSKHPLDFQVIGTPYEDFFRCPAKKYAKSASFGKLQDRCDVSKNGDENERSSRLSGFSMVGLLVLLAILGLMVFIACKYAKGLLAKSGRQDGRRVANSKSLKSSYMKLTTPTTTSSKSSEPPNLQSSTDTKTKVGCAFKPKAKFKATAKIKVKG